MNKHFNTRSEAIQHLTSNGWKQLRNGRFLSRDGYCIAQISPAFDEVVLVSVWRK